MRVDARALALVAGMIFGVSGCGGPAGEHENETPAGSAGGEGEATCGGAVCAADLEDPPEAEEDE